MGKMTLWRAICLAKVVYTMKTVVLNNLPSVRMTPLSSQTPTLDFMDGGHLDEENENLESQVLRKTCRECSGNVKGMLREDQANGQLMSPHTNL